MAALKILPVHLLYRVILYAANGQTHQIGHPDLKIPNMNFKFSIKN